MYRHTLCIYPYRKDLRRTRCFPPLGLEYIAAAVQPHSKRVDVVDLRYENRPAAAFVRDDTDLVCVSVNWDRDTDFVREQISSLPRGATVIVGGRQATAAPEQWMSDCPNIDILVRGDGEETMREIARRVPFTRIAGISYRANGAIRHNANRKYRAAPDDLVPDRSLRRYTYCWDIEGVETGLTFDSLAASRGCPFNCKFCSFNRNPWGEKRTLVKRSPESVVRELAEIKARIITLTDDMFTHDMDWVAEICDLVIARGIKKVFLVNARLEMAKRMDVVAKMEQAGFVVLLLGIESTQDRTLRAMRKGITIAKTEEYCAKLSKTGMVLHGYFILGNIGESEKEMLSIGPFAKRLGIDSLGLSTLRTTPHDGLGELVAKSPGYHVTPDGVVYSDAIAPGRLHHIRKKIWYAFYSLPHCLRMCGKFRRIGVLSAGTFRQVISAGLRALWRKRPGWMKMLFC